MMFNRFPTPIRLGLCISPVQWISAYIFFILSPILRFTRVQTSLSVTTDHIHDLINTYKPSFLISSPTFMTSLLKPLGRNRCDFSSLEHIILGGGVATKKLLNDIKSTMPEVRVYPLYGMTEACGIIFSAEDTPGRSCGRRMGHFKYRLVNPDTQEDILSENTPGELWLQGPSVFKGYLNYNNVDSTFVDGWFKTGDIFYRDEQFYYYFVDRMKLLLRYKTYQIHPMEIESVILKHPGVSDVVVTGLDDDEVGDLLVACVVPQPGYIITAQEVKDIVKEELSDIKRLRGGVVFLEQMPLTSSAKVNRKALRKIVNSIDTLIV